MKNERTAFITGGTSGLGNALVGLLLDKGWRVATCGRRQNLIDDMNRKFEENLVAFSCDIRFDNHLDSAYKTVLDNFSGLDLLVLNAGELGPVPLPRVLDTSLMDLRRTMETNFFANFNVIKRFSQILNVSSLIVHITSDASSSYYPGWGAYGSSKAAMDHLVSVLNEEYNGTGRKAVSFDPGDMNTDMHRKALPDDDPETLRNPAESAAELYEIVERKLELNE